MALLKIATSFLAQICHPNVALSVESNARGLKPQTLRGLGQDGHVQGQPGLCTEFKSSLIWK